MKLSAITLAAYLASTPWLGSQEGYDAVLQASTSLAQLEAQGPEALKAKLIEFRGGINNADPYALPPMYKVADGVGVLTVTGPLITGSAGFMRLFGVTGYDDVRQAVNELVSQKSVKSILLHVNSPGGLAAGCEDCAHHLKTLGTVKPIITYSDTAMTSAAYWLGSAGQKILAGATAVLGSIGVLITFVSYVRANEQAGIDKTVIRIGEFKALANSDEKLTEEGRAHLLAQGEQMYSVFRAGVAANLGVDEAAFDKKMGRGREFVGAQAVDAGLAHQLATFDQAVAFAKTVDMPRGQRQNSANPKGTSMKLTLAAALIAQLCAGADPLKIDFSSVTSNVEGQVPDSEGQTLLQAQAINLSAAVKTGSAAAIAAATEPLTTKITELTASLGTANTELGALRTTSKALTDAAAANAALTTKAEKVLLESANAMALALGTTSIAADLKGADLSAKHDELETAFKAKFPAAKLTVAASVEPPADAVTDDNLPLFLRIAAANRTKTAA